MLNGDRKKAFRVNGWMNFFGAMVCIAFGWNLSRYRAVMVVVSPPKGQEEAAMLPRKDDNTGTTHSTAHDGSLIWPVNVPDDGDCRYAMEYIRQLNECRGHCAITHNISKPVLHWAILERQGMGRFLESAVTTCLRAASLGRPCLVDTTVRDSFFTLRSFLAMPLDVEVHEEVKVQYGNSLFTREEALEVQDAIQRLQRPGASAWSSSDFSDNQHPTNIYQHILPLVPPTTDDNSPSLEMSTVLLDEIIRHPNRTVLSPSWGPPLLWEKVAQYEYIPPAATRSCVRDDESLMTRMHNYMFRPTKLAKELHQAYRRRVLKVSAEEEPYGAIHMRFHILKTAYKIFPKNGTDTAAMQEAIDTMAKKIWKRIEEHQQKQPEISKWWLVSDNIDLGNRMLDMLNKNAKIVSSNIHFHSDKGKARDGSANKSSVSDVDAALDRILTHRRSSAKPKHVIGSGEGTIHHSRDPEAKGILGHELMATSIVDWMVLWESDCAIVTVGAFSSSGAKGRNKVLFGDPNRVRRHMIQMYVKQPL